MMLYGYQDIAEYVYNDTDSFLEIGLSNTEQFFKAECI